MDAGSAEFRLTLDDPRRMATFDRCETTFMNAGKYFSPKLERIKVPYDDGKFLHAYFVGTPHALSARQPVVITMGGLDSFKEELYFIMGQGALERGISCLLLDGPGQGATVRREGIHARPDTEVAIAACIDYLSTRDDVDPKRIALAGTSLGGHFVTRAGSKEHRLLHAKEDVLGAQDPVAAAEYARSKGVNITYRVVTAEETGADHCQHDNPTLGSDIIADWLAQQLGIDQASLVKG
jgi:predicted alpha/beta-fold hydrolase